MTGTLSGGEDTTGGILKHQEEFASEDKGNICDPRHSKAYRCS